jgi:putative photosynthetic complex assembly protein
MNQAQLASSSNPSEAIVAHGRPSQKPLFFIMACVLALGVFIFISERFSAPFTSNNQAAVVESLQLRFEDTNAGAVVVINHQTNTTVHSFVGEASFVRTVLRSLASERIRRGVGADQAFVLSRLADGRVTLVDPITERGIELAAFGSTNAREFSKLLNVSAK